MTVFSSIPENVSTFSTLALSSVQREMDGSHSRNAVPVETFLLPSRWWRESLSVPEVLSVSGDFHVPDNVHRGCVPDNVRLPKGSVNVRVPQPTSFHAVAQIHSHSLVRDYPADRIRHENRFTSRLAILRS